MLQYHHRRLVGRDRLSSLIGILIVSWIGLLIFRSTSYYYSQLVYTMRLSLACVTLLGALAVHQNDAFSVGNLVMPRTLSRSSPFSSSTTSLNAEGSTITMPALSSTMKEGRVVSWLKSEGDEISAGEAIMVVESDKADVSFVGCV